MLLEGWGGAMSLFSTIPRWAPGAVFALLAGFTPLANAQRNLSVQPADGQRVALVIGNAAYQQGPLKNPVNDARAIADRLQRLGFVVIKRENMKAKEMGAALREFRSRLSAGATALFFYAGHGLQVKGVNYLPTVDAEIDAEEDVYAQALNINNVLELMEEAKTRVNLVFLDACRNNPFSRKFRSTAGGLAKLDAASGTLISFATRPGSVAADGVGKNGLYTEHLLKHMEEPGLPIEQVLKRTGAGVKLASKGRQEPWSEGLIEGEFYFRTGTQAGAPAFSASASAPDPATLELALWESVKDSRSSDELNAYLEQYPQGRFAGVARARLRTLIATPAQTSAPAVSTIPPQQLANFAPTLQATPPSDGRSLTLHGASQFNDEHPFTKAIVRFGELVRKYYRKPVNFVVHKNSELGLERDYLAHMNQGKAVDYAIVSPAHMSTFSKAAPFMDAPLIFRDRDHWNKVLDADVLKPVADEIAQKADVMIVGYAGGGARNIFTSKPVRNLAEMKGLRVRVQGAPIWSRTFSAAGMLPTVIAYNEIYSAIRNGVIAAGETEAAGVQAMKFYEVGPNLLMTQHAITIRPLCFSGKTFRGMDQDLQTAVLMAGKEAGAYGRLLEVSEDEQTLVALERAGKLTRVPFVDRLHLKKAAEPVIETYAREIGAEAILAKINAIN
jgi:TRAP-type C4-dicarboxylate transport system substrate-binding protein